MPLSYSTDDIRRRIIAESRRQGVDPSLMLGIALAESSLNPQSIGDNGQAVGLFQLHKAAAQDVGLSPAERYDPQRNIEGGIAYFKNRLRREGGDLDRAVSAYNQGVGTRQGQLSNPQYVQTVRQYQRREQPLLARLARTVGPREAAAAELSPQEQNPLRERLRQIEAREAAGGAPQTAPAPSGTAPQAAPAPASPSALQDRLRQIEAREATMAGSPRPAYEVEVQSGPPGTFPRPEGATPEAGPGAAGAPGAAVQEQLLREQEQQRLAAERQGSRAVPAPVPPPGQAPAPAVQRTPSGQIAFNAYLPGPEIPAGEGGPMMGEIAGQYAGTALLGPGFGTAVGGAIGAGGGQVVENVLRGEPINWRRAASEAVFSALPEVGESAVRGGVRQWLRGIPGGRQIRMDEAARRARALPEVFEAQTRQEVGRAFDAVRNSGVQLDIAPLRQEIQALRPGKFDDVMAEIRRVDRNSKTGRRYQQMFENMRQTGGIQVRGWPIGDLQDLRSALRARIEQLEPVEARQLLRDVQNAVDDAVDQGLARGTVGTGQTVQQLQQARRDWAVARASEDLATLIERTVTTTPDLSMGSFNLRQFADAMRRNTSPLAQQSNRALDQVPGARARFQRELDTIADLYRTIELPLGDVAGARRMWLIGSLAQNLSQVMVRHPEVFRQALVDGRGQLSPNAVAALVNQTRREAGLEPIALPWEEGTPGQGEAGRQQR